MKSTDRESAIRLRKEGHTYSEILAEIHVAKSTLSEWLKSVGLSIAQKQRITQKSILAARRGAEARRTERLRQLAECARRGRNHIDTLNTRELWLIGIALYWAEGSKQKATSVSTGIMFGNSDPRMIRVFLRWVKLLGISQSDLRFELYVHESRKSDVSRFRKWWARMVRVVPGRISRVYFKKGNIQTKRKNVGDLYHGLLRIKVNSSTMLNRQVNGWIEGIVASLGSGVTGNTPAFGAGESRFDP